MKAAFGQAPVRACKPRSLAAFAAVACVWFAAPSPVNAAEFCYRRIFCMTAPFAITAVEHDGPDFFTVELQAEGRPFLAAYVGNHPAFPFCEKCRVVNAKRKKLAYARKPKSVEEVLIERSSKYANFLHVFIAKDADEPLVRQARKSLLTIRLQK